MMLPGARTLGSTFGGNFSWRFGHCETGRRAGPVVERRQDMNSVSYRFQDNLKKNLEIPIDALLGEEVIHHGLDTRLERVLYDRISNFLDNEKWGNFETT